MIFVSAVQIQFLCARMDKMREETLQIFREDLWKDKRQCLRSSDNGIFLKQSENTLEHEAEVSVLNFMNEFGIRGIPKVKRQSDLNIEMTCFNGIRVFELLVQLELIAQKDKNPMAHLRKTQILKRCEERQKAIQRALIEWRKGQALRVPYPQFKLQSIIKVLSDCADVVYDEREVGKELARLNDYWQSVVAIPFRDATTKNMVFCSDELLRLEIDPSRTKTEKARAIIRTKLNDDSFWFDNEIGDFDFSSVIHDTTLEDDVISLYFHEHTYCGNPNIDPINLIWHGTPDFKRAAITFYIRYYRFGGRKAAYRIINPINHMVRFHYDHDDFYFRELNLLMRNLWPSIDNEYPLLMELTDMFYRKLGTKLSTTDSFYAHYPSAYREPWANMRETPS